MAIETRDSSLKRLIQARRVTVAASGVTSVNVPARIDKFILKNSGSTEIRLNFNDDNGPQYYSLSAGEVLPTYIDASDRETIRLRSQGGEGTVELIMWS
jgi:hypothetical protein